MEEVLKQVLASSVLAGVLFYFLGKIWSKLEEKDKEISRLNDEILTIEKDNVKALNSLSDAVNGVKEIIKITLGNKS